MPAAENGVSTLDCHVLLALAGGPLYGYAIKDAVAEESAGALTPRAGTLYRVIARLISRGFVEYAQPPHTSEPHPGLARKYYGLTSAGRAALAAEARRLRGVAALAEERLGTAHGQP